MSDVTEQVVNAEKAALRERALGQIAKAAKVLQSSGMKTATTENAKGLTLEVLFPVEPVPKRFVQGKDAKAAPVAPIRKAAPVKPSRRKKK